MTPLDRQRLHRGAAHLHTLGPRAVAEFLAEMAQRIGGAPCILDQLAEYERRMNPDFIRVAGAHRFPPRPLRAVPR